MRKFPIGIQSFENIRNDGYIYIDKTEYIWQLVQEGKVYFLSRPRRFGKSLLISTMQAYFEGKKDLFEGLSIAAHEAEKPTEEQWISYPIILFSLAGGEFTREGGLEAILDNDMAYIARRNGLAEDEIAGKDISVRFKNLIRCLHEKTGKSVVVLVDEYDKPLLANIPDNPEVEAANQTLLKSFFSILKDMDSLLKFVFITGVTKFNKVSIFSDLNQLEDISLDASCSAICGWTRQELENNFATEIAAAAVDNHFTYEECLNKLQENYDGYHFSSELVDVYNPFSLLNVLKKKRFDSFWYASGTPTFLVKSLEKYGIDLQDLSSGVTATEEEMDNYRFGSSNVIPLFFQSGYLTISGYHAEFGEYELTFPNKEVRIGFYNSLIPAISPEYAFREGGQSFAASRLIRALQKGDAESVMAMLQALLASLPYYEGQAPQNEQQWQNLLYAIFSILGQYVKAEVHTSRGRSDCILENENYVYIFEFKQDKSADEALQQIEEKGYAVPYATSGKQTVKIGANFSMEKKTLDEWKVVTDHY